MRDDGPFHLEIANESATMYVHGPLDANDCASLIDVCAGVPPEVRTLRLDFRAIGAMSGASMECVRFILAHWRATRGGEFRLCTSHLLATCAPARATAPSVAIAYARYSEAMTAAYL